jgi:predicted acetylornithine/succinylornithine family transaminase
MTIANPAEQQRLIDLARQVLTENYRQQPIVLTRGSGCHVFDASGARYLDLTAGIAACPLGHGHVGLGTAIAEQALRLIHVSNLFYNEWQIRLADELADLAVDMGPVRSFFCNSGAEANEAAIKLAKRYQTTIQGRADRVHVLSFEGSFHGRSVATVALTGQEKYRSGFGPLIEWARIVPFPETVGDTRALDAITEHTCAILLEPIQAEGGIRCWPKGYLAAVRKKCSETGTILIFDEVQTGGGRTGTFFGYEQEGCVPDVLSLAKGLAGGVPIGCMIANQEVAKGFAPGSHASTFGGNPLACAAALEVLHVIEKDDLLTRVMQAGEQLEGLLKILVDKHPGKVKEVRGRGLLRGVLVDGDAAPIVARVRERSKVLLSVAGGNVVRFAPPFIVSDDELAEGVAALDAALVS